MLTAAHCVSNPEKDWVAPAYRAIFSPDYREGRQGAAAIGAALAIGRGYAETGHVSGDLALLRLKAPIPERIARPIPVAGTMLLRGRELATYSYGYDAPFALAPVRVPGQARRRPAQRGCLPGSCVSSRTRLRPAVPP